MQTKNDKVNIGIILIIMFLTMSGSLYGKSNPEKDLSVYFRINRSDIEVDYMSNREALGRILSVFTPENLPFIERIYIEAFASPEGPRKLNERLSQARAESIKHYVLNHSALASKLDITAKGVGENWEGLRRLIEEDRYAPHKKEMLALVQQVIDNPSQSINYREALQTLGNTTWRYVQRYYLPYLRLEAIIIVYVDPNAPELVLKSIREALANVNGVEVKKDFKLNHSDGLNYLSHYDLPHQFAQNSATRLKLQLSELSLPSRSLVNTYNPRDKYAFALKTNLLFDALSLLNVEAEFPLGNRYSVAGEWTFPWWTFDNGKADSKRHRIQLLNANIDLKYWFGERTRENRLRGFFVGIYGGAGKYDFEYSRRGVQGEHYIFTGISGGYSHSISKHFYMEYSLGLGYLKTDYREYDAKWGYDKKWHPVFDKAGSYTWIGPTKVKISIGWMINL